MVSVTVSQGRALEKAACCGSRATPVARHRETSGFLTPQLHRELILGEQGAGVAAAPPAHLSAELWHPAHRCLLT